MKSIKKSTFKSPENQTYFQKIVLFIIHSNGFQFKRLFFSPENGLFYPKKYDNIHHFSFLIDYYIKKT